MKTLAQVDSPGSAGRRPRRTTIQQVAEIAGVSPTTVSHVLSGNRPVAAGTRERVLNAVDTLGYRPSSLARSLRTRRSETIGFIVPDITNPFYAAQVRGLHDATGDDYLTYVCNTEHSRETELRLVFGLQDRQVDGIVMAGYELGTADIQETLDSGIPIVALTADLDDPRVDVVLTDDEKGSFEATEHLIERGHRRIGVIHGEDRSGWARRDGYLRALRAAGIQHDSSLVRTGDWTRSGGYVAMKELLDLDDRPSAAFAANDLMAIGAMDAAREAQIEIPGGLALVGFDDIDAAALVNPPLTTVVNPATEIGRTAGRLLMERILGYTGPRRRVVLNSELVVRGSS